MGLSRVYSSTNTGLYGPQGPSYISVVSGSPVENSKQPEPAVVDDAVSVSLSDPAKEYAAAQVQEKGPETTEQPAAQESTLVQPPNASGLKPEAQKEVAGQEKPKKETAQAQGKEKAESEGSDGQEDEQAEKQEIAQLKQRDREVRSHEQAHLSALGQYARGGASYTLETGPDGKQYAVGGEVPVDVSPEKTPEETIRKAQTVRRGALAPSDPSTADRQVAASASQLEAQARAEMVKENQQASSSEKKPVEEKPVSAAGKSVKPEQTQSTEAVPGVEEPEAKAPGAGEKDRSPGVNLAPTAPPVEPPAFNVKPVIPEIQPPETINKPTVGPMAGASSATLKATPLFGAKHPLFSLAPGSLINTQA
jgi:hypothetical protein